MERQNWLTHGQTDRINVEKQCGVLYPNGMQCARAITCKLHSVEVKRAVPGRSQPFDTLLAAFQVEVALAASTRRMAVGEPANSLFFGAATRGGAPPPGE